MGPTGSGKSNFVNKLTRSKEDKAASGLKSHTQGIREFSVDTSKGRYVFVDTPGFDDTYRSDRDILRTIAEWLERSGIIYTHRITDNRMSGSVSKNLDLFGRLCGDKAAEHVLLVTTMWDRARDPNIAASRKIENTTESAWDIVSDVVGGTEAVLLQEELVDAERKLNETTAGKALYTQFQRLLQEQKDAIKKLSEEAKTQQDPALARDLQVEYEKIETQLQKTWEEMEKLRIPFLRRISLFFSRRPQAVSIILPFEMHLTNVDHSAQFK
ncbi:P-loop containing nucleoside triphosphate hydrolase protein [Scleroderma yunnanense]